MINIITDMVLLPLFSISLVCLLEESYSPSNTLIKMSSLEIDIGFLFMS